MRQVISDASDIARSLVALEDWLGAAYPSCFRLRTSGNPTRHSPPRPCAYALASAHVQDLGTRPLPGCIVMSDGRFKFSTQQQQAAFVHRQAGAVLPYYEAARVANSFYAKQHG